MTTPTDLRHAPDKWIVGLDLRTAGAGAIKFAAWLHSVAETALVGIHVLEEAYLQAALVYHDLSALERSANKAADSAVAAAGATAALPQHHFVQGVRASNALSAAMSSHGAGGIIVGRQAPRKGRHLVRLGRTARRLLRTLPGPVIVVPPDYTPPTRPDAPVVVTTNLHEDAAHAVRFAREFATAIGRPLVVLHVVVHIDDYAAYYIPEESRKKIAAEDEAAAKLGLMKWLTGLGVHADRQAVVLGPVTDSIAAFADAEGAALLVTGSRRLTTVERVLLTSIGSDLAAHASCPVAVVPPLASDLEG